MSLFKTASEVFDQANDYLLRGDFGTALNKYNDAIRKFQKVGDQNGVILASASTMSVAPSRANPATVGARCSSGRWSQCSQRGCRSSGTAP